MISAKAHLALLLAGAWLPLAAGCEDSSTETHRKDGGAGSDAGPVTCGNGAVDPGETCDGNCPTSCDDEVACTLDSETGDAAHCNVACAHSSISQCTGGDGCCPADCTFALDDDCAKLADYYVTQSGAGTHDGSLGNEWSVAEYNASSAPGPGDTVLFSGTITSTVAPITGGDSSARLTLDFAPATLNTASPRIDIHGQSFLNLYGGTLGAAGGIEPLIASGDVEAHDITISGWTHTGADDGVALFIQGPQLSNLLVENNTVDNVRNFYQAWRPTSHDVTIRNNYARSSTNELDQTDVIFCGSCQNLIIEGNKLINRAPGHYSDGNRHNDVIQTFSSDGGASYPSGWIIRYNWIEIDAAKGDGSNSWLMLEAMDGDPAIEIHSNVFLGHGNSGNNGVCVTLNLPTGVFYFYNNTVIRKLLPANTIRFEAPGILHAKNNVGLSELLADAFLTWSMTPGAPWDRNFFFNVYGCSESYSGPSGSCVADPKFVDFAANDFALQPISPLIGAGDNTLGAKFEMGLAPTATWPNPALAKRTGNWDVGAYVAPAAP